MASVTITIPDAKLAEVLAAFQSAYPGDWATAQAAGLTAAQFARRVVARFVKDVYQGQQAQAAAEAARTSSLSATDSVVIT